MSLFSDSQTVEVVAAVLERDGRFLIAQRPSHKRHGGLWEFPGGKCEEGESLPDALRRELAEELGLSLESVGETLLRIADSGSPFVINFIRVTASGTPVPTEHQGLGWMTLTELAALALAPSDRVFVESMSLSACNPLGSLFRR